MPVAPEPALPVTDLEALVELWPAVVELVRAEHALLRRGDRRHAPGRRSPARI